MEHVALFGKLLGSDTFSVRIHCEIAFAIKPELDVFGVGRDFNNFLSVNGHPVDFDSDLVLCRRDERMRTLRMDEGCPRNCRVNGAAFDYRRDNGIA